MPILPRLRELYPTPIKSRGQSDPLLKKPENVLLIAAVQEALQLWQRSNTVRTAPFILPNAVGLPEEVQQALDAVTRDHKIPLMSMLASTAFPWLSTNSRQQKCNIGPVCAWLVFVFAREQKLSLVYEMSSYYKDFKRDILTLIRVHAPTFSFWMDYEPPTTPTALVPSQNALGSWDRTNVKAAAHALKMKTQDLIKRWSNDLQEIHAGSIVAPGGAVYLHPAVHDTAIPFFKACVFFVLLPAAP